MPSYLLDPRTTVLIAGITSGLMALVLSLLARATPLPVPGLSAWVCGAWLVFIALLLLGMRDWISPLVSITLGNSALLLAYIVWLAGTMQHFGKRIHRFFWLAIWTTSIAAVTWFVYGLESFRVRVIIVAGLSTYVGICHACFLLRNPRAADRFGTSIGITLTTSWLVILSLVYGLRVLHAVVRPQGTSGLLTQDVIQIIYTSSFTICNLMLVIGFATMASDYVRALIEERSIHDPLTGALNREALLKCLERERERSLHSPYVFCVIMVDVDYFKKINDNHGHLVGDRVLTCLCQRMQSLVRSQDVLARFGGEEFIIVMPDTQLSTALSAARRIQHEAVMLNDPALPSFTISLGLAEWSSEEDSVEAIVARADMALYAAKNNGRNCIEVAA